MNILQEKEIGETILLQSKITDNGYIKILTDDGWILEHKYIIQKFIGRELNPEEVIHHIDSNRKNNILSNLMLFPNQKAHAHFHRQIKQFGLTRPRLREIKDRWKNINENKLKASNK